jgi:hypothetical protein
MRNFLTALSKPDDTKLPAPTLGQHPGSISFSSGAEDRGVVILVGHMSDICHSEIYPNNPWRVVEELLHYSNNINKVMRIIARSWWRWTCEVHRYAPHHTTNIY